MAEVKKQYGTTLLYESVFEAAHRNLFHYIEDYNLSTLATPICVHNDADTLSPSNLSSCTFSFRIGLMPSFELPTMVNATAYRITTVDEEDLQKIIERTRREHATYTQATEITPHSFLIGDIKVDGDMVDQNTSRHLVYRC